jgi:hypothetical protein
MFDARAITRSLAIFESVSIRSSVIPSVKDSSFGPGLMLVSDKSAMRCLSCERPLNVTALVTLMGCNLSDHHRPSQDLKEGILEVMEGAVRCGRPHKHHPVSK